MKIVHSLLAQDIHPSFEDNLEVWLGLLSRTLKLERPSQNSHEHHESLFKAKGECLRLVLLYVLKYSAEF